MKIYHGIDRVESKIKNPVVALGVFDGLHQGHQKLIKQVVARAKILNGTPMVMTFSPHPVHVLRPQAYLPLIISLPHRLSLLEGLGIKACVVVRFTKRFSALSPEGFVRSYLNEKIRPREIVVGDDFRFGKGRDGGVGLFKSLGKTFGFTVRLITSRQSGKKVIGSTQIRRLIAQGRIKAASRLLGRPVSLLGTVARGDTRGQTLGYPTANINPPHAVILPLGVFVVRAIIKGRPHLGIANVGKRPSFKRAGEVNVEVHLFDFKKNIYGQEMIVEFLQKIREEKQFWSEVGLVYQIRQDEKRAKSWIKRQGRSLSKQ